MTHIDAQRIQRYYKIKQRGALIDNALASTRSLGMLMSDALRDAACEQYLVLRDAKVASINVALEAGLALLRGAAAGGAALEYTIAGRTVTRMAEVSESQAHVGRWLDIFEAASVVRDRAALATLCAVPLEVVLGSSTAAEPFQQHWVRFLHTFAATGRFAPDLLMRAMKATDPNGLLEDVRDYALYVVVPTMHLYYQIAVKSSGGFEQAAGEALEKHERYWSRADQAHVATGFISWPISAAVSIATERGVAERVASPYVIDL